jgi:hypothetical protein
MAGNDLSGFGGNGRGSATGNNDEKCEETESELHDGIPFSE